MVQCQIVMNYDWGCCSILGILSKLIMIGSNVDLDKKKTAIRTEFDIHR